MKATVRQAGGGGRESVAPDLESEFGGRLVTLSTGQAGLRSALAVRARPAAPEAEAGGPELPLMDFLASDATLDRAGEVVAPEGWRLENYRRNPVFQNAHHYDNILFTLGRATAVEVRGGHLWLRVQFATHINPLARMAYELYRGGFLRAVSVGFIPLRWENGTERTAWRRRFLEQELLEVSAVPVPANPNALALAVKAGALGRAEVQAVEELLQLTRQALPGGGAGAEPWLRLAAATARLLGAG
ncbi:MAG: HK97 family phage prohead protease [Verrucomicrobiae bacterium]|nr:HK97 family phage prohead protease [Verrucomicrobiae bacterium]